MTRVVLLLCILFISCSDKEHSNISISEIPKEQMEFQKMVISQLSGESSIRLLDSNQVVIHDRWNSKGKDLTVQYLKEIIEKIGLKPEIHSYSIPNSNFAVDLLIEPLKGNNVYTILSSTTQSKEYVVLGAHYDTGGDTIPGAIDNGSGIALILSVLRQVKELRFRNKNLIVVFFDQEEESVRAGSITFAKYLKSKDLNIHSVHSFDMIGWDSDNNKEIELALPQFEIEQIYKQQASLLNIPIYTTKINSSDHYSFIKEGINAICVSQAYSKGDNSGKKDTPEDTYNLVNFEYLESSTTLAFEVIKVIMND